VNRGRFFVLPGKVAPHAGLQQCLICAKKSTSLYTAVKKVRLPLENGLGTVEATTWHYPEALIMREAEGKYFG